MTSFYTTGNQRLAVILATLGIAPFKENPVTVQLVTDPRTGEQSKRTTFHFDSVGTWYGFGGNPQLPVSADDIAAAFYRRPNKLADPIARELALIAQCLDTRENLNRVRKSLDPNESHVGLAIAENIAAFEQITASARVIMHTKLKWGTLIAPADDTENAIKRFSQFT